MLVITNCIVSDKIRFVMECILVKCEVQKNKISWNQPFLVNKEMSRTYAIKLIIMSLITLLGHYEYYVLIPRYILQSFE